MICLLLAKSSEVKHQYVGIMPRCPRPVATHGPLATLCRCTNNQGWLGRPYNRRNPRRLEAVLMFKRKRQGRCSHVLTLRTAADWANRTSREVLRPSKTGSSRVESTPCTLQVCRLAISATLNSCAKVDLLAMPQPCSTVSDDFLRETHPRSYSFWWVCLGSIIILLQMATCTSCQAMQHWSASCSWPTLRCQ